MRRSACQRNDRRLNKIKERPAFAASLPTGAIGSIGAAVKISGGWIHPSGRMCAVRNGAASQSGAAVIIRVSGLNEDHQDEAGAIDFFVAATRTSPSLVKQNRSIRLPAAILEPRKAARF